MDIDKFQASLEGDCTFRVQITITRVTKAELALIIAQFVSSAPRKAKQDSLHFGAPSPTRHMPESTKEPTPTAEPPTPEPTTTLTAASEPTTPEPAPALTSASEPATEPTPEPTPTLTATSEPTPTTPTPEPVVARAPRVTRATRAAKTPPQQPSTPLEAQVPLPESPEPTVPVAATPAAPVNDNAIDPALLESSNTTELLIKLAGIFQTEVPRGPQLAEAVCQYVTANRQAFKCMNAPPFSGGPDDVFSKRIMRLIKYLPNHFAP